MLGNGIFSIFGAGLNAAMSVGAANEQWGNQLKLMEIQNRYNEQMAKNNQLRNKDLWDYTNYENQKQHIKKRRIKSSAHVWNGRWRRCKRQWSTRTRSDTTNRPYRDWETA